VSCVRAGDGVPDVGDPAPRVDARRFRSGCGVVGSGTTKNG